MSWEHVGSATKLMNININNYYTTGWIILHQWLACGNYAGIIVGILIADAVLELFQNNMEIIENNARILKSSTHLSNNMETK